MIRAGCGGGSQPDAEVSSASVGVESAQLASVIPAADSPYAGVAEKFRDEVPAILAQSEQIAAKTLALAYTEKTGTPRPPKETLPVAEPAPLEPTVAAQYTGCYPAGANVDGVTPGEPPESLSWIRVVGTDAPTSLVDGPLYEVPAATSEALQTTITPEISYFYRLS